MQVSAFVGEPEIIDPNKLQNIITFCYDIIFFFFFNKTNYLLFIFMISFTIFLLQRAFGMELSMCLMSYEAELKY